MRLSTALRPLLLYLAIRLMADGLAVWAALFTLLFTLTLSDE